jgi:hypothetical protein
MVTFVFTNPKHHVDMMVPVARELERRGEKTRFVSLSELRGHPTPDLQRDLPATSVARAMPRIRRNPSAGAGLGEGGGAGAFARTALQKLVWHGGLGPRLRWLVRDSDVVVVPNDAAFPYGPLARMLHDRGVPFALMQEGIRFPLPTEQRAGAPYGGSGAAAICTWGEASAEHFRTVAPATSVCVTGNPRWDDVDPAAWEARGQALMTRLGLDRRPLLYLSNTIDDQGFCTTADKMNLFRSFIERSKPTLLRERRALVVKLHLREDLAAFREVASAFSDVPVHVVDANLFEVLAIGHAAVVLASTVGLEALAFGVPLGVLAIPGHGHVFEYVSRGVAVGLSIETLDATLPSLLAQERGITPAMEAFLERHLAHRGKAAAQIADCLVELQLQKRLS